MGSVMEYYVNKLILYIKQGSQELQSEWRLKCWIRLQSNKHTPHLSPQLLKCFEDYALFLFVMSTWVYFTLQTRSKLKVLVIIIKAGKL